MNFLSLPFLPIEFNYAGLPFFCPWNSCTRDTVNVHVAILLLSYAADVPNYFAFSCWMITFCLVSEWTVFFRDSGKVGAFREYV